MVINDKVIEQTFLMPQESCAEKPLLFSQGSSYLLLEELHS
jgi:hypothetical protein